MPTEPTRARLIGSVLAVITLAVAVWWVIEARSVAPPPPPVVFPWATPTPAP